MEVSTTEEQGQNLRINEAAEIDILEQKILLIKDGGRQWINNNVGRLMHKVPPLLRLDKNNQQDYDPLVVSFGPYHHGKKELQAAEDFKLAALQMFVHDSGKDASYFYQEVFERVDDARRFYPRDSTKEYDDRRFAQMMLLDACFMIKLIAGSSRYTNWTTRYHLGDLADAIILRDAFLLENQIPFSMLQFLICSRYGEEQGREMINNFLYSTMFGKYNASGAANRGEVQRPLHLLDAFRQVILSESCEFEGMEVLFRLYERNDKIRSCLHECISKLLPCCPWGRGYDMENDGKINIPCFRSTTTGNSSSCTNNVCSGSWSLRSMPKFSCLRRCISNLPWRRSGDVKENDMKNYIHCFRSATDLKAKGIHFRPSSADSLMGFKFQSGYFYALLEVPCWFVSIYTKVFFLNMIAYEMCPRSSNYKAVTAYIEFMKSLIDNPKDVKELREKRILLTTLGSDEEVVKVYKDINTYGLDNSGIFNDVKEEIQAHYNNKAKTWLAELFYTYFRSPWTALALFAASFLLVLTFLQTYYTVRPS